MHLKVSTDFMYDHIRVSMFNSSNIDANPKYLQKYNDCAFYYC